MINEVVNKKDVEAAIGYDKEFQTDVEIGCQINEY